MRWNASMAATALIHAIPMTVIVVFAFGFNGTLLVAAIGLTVFATLMVQMPLIQRTPVWLSLVAALSTPIAWAVFNGLAAAWALSIGMPITAIWHDSFMLATMIPAWFGMMRLIT